MAAHCSKEAPDFDLYSLATKDYVSKSDSVSSDPDMAIYSYARGIDIQEAPESEDRDSWSYITPPVRDSEPSRETKPEALEQTCPGNSQSHENLLFSLLLL